MSMISVSNTVSVSVRACGCVRMCMRACALYACMLETSFVIMLQQSLSVIYLRENVCPKLNGINMSIGPR